MRAPAVARRAAPLLLTLLALAVGLAGCIGAQEDADRVVATATDAYLVPPNFAYDGQGVQAADGTLLLDVTDSTNTGSVTGQVTAAGSNYTIDFTRFLGNASHQDGGINNGFQEHGATGAGDASIPEIRAISAGWGLGTATVDGEPLLDPVTGDANLSMHYMITDTGVRDDGDRSIRTADGEAIYAPTNGSDGRAVPGDREVHLLVKSTQEPPPGMTTTFDDIVRAPPGGEPVSYSQEHTFNVNGTRANVTVLIELTSPDPDDQIFPANLDFVLRGPDGARIDQANAGLLSSSSARLISGPLTETGEYTLEVSGWGVQVAYEAETFVRYPTPLLLHFYFEDVRL